MRWSLRRRECELISSEAESSSTINKECRYFVRGGTEEKS